MTFCKVYKWDEAARFAQISFIVTIRQTRRFLPYVLLKITVIPTKGRDLHKPPEFLSYLREVGDVQFQYPPRESGFHLQPPSGVAKSIPAYTTDVTVDIGLRSLRLLLRIRITIHYLLY